MNSRRRWTPCWSCSSLSTTQCTRLPSQDIRCQLAEHHCSSQASGRGQRIDRPSCDPQGDLSQLGRMVLQGGFSVWISHKRAAVRMKELARFKPMQRHLFLYEHALLFCKRRDEDPADRATPFYSFKSCLRVRSSSATSPSQSHDWLTPLAVDGSMFSPLVLANN